ncbi:hypothetical protein [Lacrimispora sp.]|uniref:hypothetical protein n=1 Tax=Lacrimispora sp. TaxID=2719234 RepID=UPI0028AFF605|nr:hypothetical protein [Lacrimispora sp.]
MKNRDRKEVSQLSRKEGVGLAERWRLLSDCRDFPSLVQNASPSLLDLFEMQVKEYLNMGELSERYLNEVPRSICWYEGLIDTEMLLMEIGECAVL